MLGADNQQGSPLSLQTYDPSTTIRRTTTFHVVDDIV